MPEVKIVLVDDHQLVRLGLRTMLQSEPGFQVIGEACDGQEAIQLVDRFQPDVVILDLQMPGLSGMETLRLIKVGFPHIQIVILSAFDDEAFVVEALSAGACSYVLKASTNEDLVAAVRDALVGKRYLSPSISERAIEAYIKTRESAKVMESHIVEVLTPREQEVLRLTSQGFSNKDIAEMFTLSPRTVESHRINMMRKLGLHSQVDLVNFALKNDLLTSKQT